MDQQVFFIVLILAISGILIPLVYLLRYVLANRYFFPLLSFFGDRLVGRRKISISIKIGDTEISIEAYSKEELENSIETIEKLLESTKEAN